MKINMITLIALVLSFIFSCADNSKTSENLQRETTVEFTASSQKAVDSPKPIIEKEVSIQEAKVKAEKEEQPIDGKTYQTTSLDEGFEEETTSKSDVIENIESTIQQVDMDSSSAMVGADVQSDLDSESQPSGLLNEMKADHSVFNDLLSKYVTTSGVVNYKGLKSEIDQLDAYLEELDENSISSDWSRNEKLAYWINVYNAFTIKLILDHFPVNSIQDIANGKPWDLKWIKLGGKTYSLNQIENEIIRPEFKEPRIHFAVNCAAQSCPPLANEAFTDENLDSLLEKQTKAFINNSKYNKITTNSVKISKIFDWYGEDFGNIIVFLKKYSNSQIAVSAKIEYTDYDWNLNNK